MRLELAERLVCPAPHEPTPLIVVALEAVGRDLRRAQLGCMICHRQGEVRDGSVHLGAADRSTREGVPFDAAPLEPFDDATLRLAALLGLSEPDALVLLGARHEALAPLLAERHDAIVAVFGAAGPSPADVGHVQVAEARVPFTSGSFAAAALDTSMNAAVIADAVRCVRLGGRIVGSADLPLPLGVRELARDAQGWVGEVEAASSPVIPLRRA